MKIFLDSGNLDEILYWKDKVDGFTTNPTLLKKGKVSNYKWFAEQVLNIIDNKPVSFEVLSDLPEEMERQIRIISSWGKNVYVKIPIMYTNGILTTSLINKLSEDGIKLNITAVTTSQQCENIVNALNVYTPSIISIFAGRIADTGRCPESIIKNALYMSVGKPKVEILWASTREVYNIIQAKNYGSNIITVTPEILKKMDMVGMDLNELSLMTVKQFCKDAEGLTI